MLQTNPRPKLIGKVLNDALGRESKSTDVKKMIDEDSNSKIIWFSGRTLAQEPKTCFFLHIT